MAVRPVGGEVHSHAFLSWDLGRDRPIDGCAQKGNKRAFTDFVFGLRRRLAQPGWVEILRLETFAFGLGFDCGERRLVSGKVVALSWIIQLGFHPGAEATVNDCDFVPGLIRMPTMLRF
jgi:hypothetical protein